MPIKIYFDNEPRFIEDNGMPVEKYKRITAAGGLVTNDDGKVLMIFRRGKWDLPKGKFEDNETIEECAEREVMEETGLTKIALKKPLLITYHTYTESKEYYLKETHWFLFEAPETQQLTPQIEEDITKIEWVDASHLKKYTANTYGLIKDVLDAGGY